MKRYVVVVVAALLALSLLGCFDADGGEGTGCFYVENPKGTESQISTDDFTLSIDRVELVKGEDGSDEVLIIFGFTNKLDISVTFASQIWVFVYQNGRSLVTARPVENTATDLTGQFDQVLPGEWYPVKDYYVPIDHSPVLIEIRVFGTNPGDNIFSGTFALT